MSEYGYLAHHGIKGQKWGIRRYENLDGTLTEAGKARYGRSQRRSFRKSSNEAYRNAKSLVRSGKITKDSKQFMNAKRDKIVSKYGSGKDLYDYLKGNKAEKNSAIESSFKRRKGRIATATALSTAGGLTLAAGTAATAAAITSALSKIGLLTIATGTTAGAAVIGKAIVDSEAGKRERARKVAEENPKFHVIDENEMLNKFNERHPINPTVNFTEPEIKSRPEKVTLVSTPLAKYGHVLDDKSKKSRYNTGNWKY